MEHDAKKCNKFDNKEKCYEALPCLDTCGFREVVLSGENNKHEFGTWIFSPNQKDFTVFAHNAKA